MSRVVVLLILSILPGARELDAKLRPLGQPFLLSDCLECEDEVALTVASGGDAFYVTWCASLPTARFSAFGRVFDADGTAGAGRRFGDDSRQTGCRNVGVDGAGDFVALWQHPAEIWLQRFDSLGFPSSDPFRVNDPPTGIDDDIARIGVDSQGFAAVGFYASLAGEPHQVYARIVSPDNRRIGPAVLLSGAFPVVLGDGLTIATLGDTGVFYVLWQTRLDAGQAPDQAGPKGMSMRRLNRQGEVVGPEIVLVEPSGRHLTLAPDLVGDPKGEFLVAAWQTNQSPASASGDAVALFVGPQGEPLVGPFRLNKKKGGAQLSPRIAFSPRNEVVAVWETDKGGTATLFGRQVRRNGSFRGRERPLTDPVPVSAVPGFAALGAEFATIGTASRAVAVWSENGGLFGRLVAGAR